jgi:hypothetical protein
MKMIRSWLKLIYHKPNFLVIPSILITNYKLNYSLTLKWVTISAQYDSLIVLKLGKSCKQCEVLELSRIKKIRHL